MKNLFEVWKDSRRINKENRKNGIVFYLIGKYLLRRRISSFEMEKLGFEDKDLTYLKDAGILKSMEVEKREKENGEIMRTPYEIYGIAPNGISLYTSLKTQELAKETKFISALSVTAIILSIYYEKVPDEIKFAGLVVILFVWLFFIRDRKTFSYRIDKILKENNENL